MKRGRNHLRINSETDFKYQEEEEEEEEEGRLFEDSFKSIRTRMYTLFVSFLFLILSVPSCGVWFLF